MGGIENEMLDVVNDDDEVIDSLPFLEVKQKKLNHRGAAVLVFKDDSYSEILVQKRSQEIVLPGLLNFPGGHVSAGQSYLEGAKMELEEEAFYGVGLPEGLEFEELFKFVQTGLSYKMFVMLYRCVCSGPFVDEPEEVESSEFVKMDELIEDIKKQPDKYTTGTVQMVEQYIEKVMT